MPFSICFSAFCLPIQKVRTKTWFLKEGMRAMKQNSSMFQYKLFHAAPDRNWFLHLMSHSCAKVVQYSILGRDALFPPYLFALEQFKIRRWKANGQTNLMTYKNIKSDYYSPINRVISFSKPKSQRKAEPSFSLVFFSPYLREFGIWNKVLESK